VNTDKDRLCTVNLEEMVSFKAGIRIFCILLSMLQGAKPVRGFNEWAERRGRSAIIREWGMISPDSKNNIIDMWVDNGSISKSEAKRLRKR